MLIGSTSRNPHRWPTALRHDGRDFLTTAQVARVLGVKAESVYAYVSRGQLDSVRIAGIRGSLFAVGEVEAFRSRTERRPPAGIVERIHTELTLIERDRLYYRGCDATELAFSTDFENVAEMLWGTMAGSDHRGGMAVPDISPTPDRGVDLIRLVVDHLGAADRYRGRIASDAVAYKAMCTLNAILTVLPVVSEFPRRGSSMAARLWPRLSPMAPTTQRVALLNAALVLLADHDLAAVTDLLARAGIDYPAADFKRVASARQLYHWNAAAHQEY